MEGALNDIKIEYHGYDSESGDVHLLLADTDEEIDTNSVLTISPDLINTNYTFHEDSSPEVQYQIIKNMGVLEQIQKITDNNVILSHKSCWTKPMVKCLINCYRELILEFRDPLKKQKHVWIKTAQLMMKNNFDVTWSQCDRKWRNLKHTFKKYYYSRKKDKKVQWEFYDDLVILFAPDCREEFKGKQRMSRIILPPNDQEPASCFTLPGIDNVPFKSETKLSPLSSSCSSDTTKVDSSDEGTPPKWFVDFMSKYEERQDKRLQEMRTMHLQILEVEKRKFSTLQELLSQIIEKQD